MNARYHDDVPPRVDWHLCNWADFMRSDATKGLRAPGKSSGFVGGGYNNDFDSMVLQADRSAAEIVDALIQGLTPGQSAAVHNRYLACVFRFPRQNQEDAFRQACDRLAIGIEQKGLV